ncbi:ankyrin repeat and LEM domain-containing protein 1-like isoform X2 [Neocloeon triangulifer]|uniref:ankyrin repeat and LEM domain-containing protein 1-like isoform X2 n=1 Tax=Neocloeon triangulifer TaxID=2078957 RepID=UPI00286F9334|nr:ankyrin repeat and LEM domain-containing protein 1-like isoform X2 [Neocloeon triangulifer]
MDKQLFTAIKYQNILYVLMNIILATKLLEQDDANPNHVDFNIGIAPIHLAVGLSHPKVTEILKIILKFGGDPNCRAADGTTPVHVAAAWGKCDVLEVLICNGGDATLTDNDGLTALDYAQKEGNKEVIEILRKSFYLEEQNNHDLSLEQSEPKFTIKLERIGVEDLNIQANTCFDAENMCLGLESLNINEGRSSCTSDKDEKSRIKKEVVEWCHKYCGFQKSDEDDKSAPDSACDEFFSCGSLSAGQSTIVSEVYKYCDESKGVTLFEKRILPMNAEMGLKCCKKKSQSSSDEEEVLQRSCSSLPSLHSELGYSTDSLRNELIERGFTPGPITKSTKVVYLHRLARLKKGQQQETSAQPQEIIKFSRELEKTLQDISNFNQMPAVELEQIMVEEFNASILKGRKWRGGNSKNSFTYLLLDPRISDNLPLRSSSLELCEVWKAFVSSIFYVGKGKRSRPYSHLYEAVDVWSGKKVKDGPKIERILDIWNSGAGVVCLHVFQSVIAVEAFTREAAMIEALGLNNLCNLKAGEYYGKVSTKSSNVRCNFGVYLLQNAMKILLHEGERQLFPNDIS